MKISSVRSLRVGMIACATLLLALPAIATDKKPKKPAERAVRLGLADQLRGAYFQRQVECRPSFLTRPQPEQAGANRCSPISQVRTILDRKLASEKFDGLNATSTHLDMIPASVRSVRPAKNQRLVD